MRAYLIFLAVIMLSASVVAEAPEVMLINESGEVKLMEKPPTWRPLSEAENTALNNPGQEVPINPLISGSKRVDFWHLALTQKYSEVVVFKDGQIQTIPKIGTTEIEPQIALYVIFCLITAGLMLISNLMMIMSINIKDNAHSDTASAAFVSSATFVAFAAFVASATFVAFAAFATAFFVAFVAANNRDPSSTKSYWISSLLFYMFVTLAMFI